jgi:hypothetical protein
VRQEVFGTNDLTIHCGMHRIGLAEFIAATRRISHFKRRLSNALRAAETSSLSVPPSVSALVDSYQHAGTDRHDYEPPRQRLRYGAHWLRVLNEGADFEVTDPRDKVYGVLGIITSPTTKLYVESPPNIQRAEFPISYTKSVSEVYQDVIKHLVNLDGNLDVLQIFEDRRNRAKDLPSWVTDWRQSTRRSILQCPPDDKTELERIGRAPGQDLNDLGKLRLIGVQVGKPLRGLNVRSREESEGKNFPESRHMDSNYAEIIGSNCFVWGTFRISGSWSDASMLGSSPVPRILVPRVAKLDDIVVAMLGSSCLFLLRPLRQDQYKFLGPVVRNVGHLPEWSKVTVKTFILV